MKKRLLTTLLSLCLLCSMAVPALAFEEQENVMPNTLSDGTVVERNAIVLQDEADVKEMIKNDEETYAREYAAKVGKIAPQLKRDFEEFTAENDDTCARTYDEIIDTFTSAYPDYKNANIEKDIITLQDNVTADLIRDFYRAKGYTIALALFNHSLTSNPAKAYLDIIGNTAGIYHDIRVQLVQKYDFFRKMVSFSQLASSYKTETIQTYVFDDINTDMYWAIHKFDWKRTRTGYNKAYFKIIDRYDFAGGPAITGVIASMAGTHEFDVEIYGLVQNGILK